MYQTVLQMYMYNGILSYVGSCDTFLFLSMFLYKIKDFDFFREGTLLIMLENYII